MKHIVDLIFVNIQKKEKAESETICETDIISGSIKNGMHAIVHGKHVDSLHKLSCNMVWNRSHMSRDMTKQTK